MPFLSVLRHSYRLCHHSFFVCEGFIIIRHDKSLRCPRNYGYLVTMLRFVGSEVGVHFKEKL